MSLVSIPFKREGTGRHPVSTRGGTTIIRFHSLQTGRHSQTNANIERDEAVAKFRFPSNGKAQSDKKTLDAIEEAIGIWFPFPSNGKAQSDLS